jgi:hypothetical protein
VIGPETCLVIDGYTRCATTFAVYAFQLAQPRPVRMAHHLHAPAQLIAAARRGLPTIALIREPRGAILSQLIREPDVDLRDALVAYTRFYRSLMAYAGSFVLGEFDEVTSDFGAVIRRVNRRFATSFAEFDHTQEQARACFDLIELRPTLSPELLGFESGTVTLDRARLAAAALRGRGESRGASDAWIPSADRRQIKEALEGQWSMREVAELRAGAEAAYRDFVLAAAGGE